MVYPNLHKTEDEYSRPHLSRSHYALSHLDLSRIKVPLARQAQARNGPSQDITDEAFDSHGDRLPAAASGQTPAF